MRADSSRAPLICHFTTVHHRGDNRIFHKQCLTLANAGFRVTLVVADGKGMEIRNGVHIEDLGKPANRWIRMTKFVRDCYEKALSICADIYQFHDPELLTIAALLARKGKRVIFDSHEIVPLTILSKNYLPSALKALLSKSYGHLETRLVRDLEAVFVPQEKMLGEHFRRHTKRVHLVRNFVDVSEYEDSRSDKKGPWEPGEPIRLIYAGRLGTARGLFNMLEIAHRLGSRCELCLAGLPGDAQELEAAKQHPGWARVDYKGLVDRGELAQLYARAHVGLMLFEPKGQYAYVQHPLKMFEYLLFGLPVLTPRFAIWQDFEREHGVSKCVDTRDPEASCKQILAWCENPEEYQKRSRKARALVREHFAWQDEAQRLVGFMRERCGWAGEKSADVAQVG